MKKLIYTIGLLGILFACKKQNIEPIYQIEETEEQTDTTETYQVNSKPYQVFRNTTDTININQENIIIDLSNWKDTENDSLIIDSIYDIRIEYFDPTTNITSINYNFVGEYSIDENTIIYNAPKFWSDLTGSNITSRKIRLKYYISDGENLVEDFKLFELLQ